MARHPAPQTDSETRSGDSGYFFNRPSKSELRKQQIIDSAIRCYATFGAENTTYEKIAKVCKVTRPLIQHYFPDRDELFAVAVHYIRWRYQRAVVERVEKAQGPLDKLRAYIDASQQWVIDEPLHSKAWALFFYHCSINPKFKALNTELVATGTQRIMGLLSAAQTQGALSPKLNVAFAARAIQHVLTGAIVAAGTETLTVPWNEFKNSTQSICLRFLDPNPS